ncbi:hypothetical protein A3F05_00520 [Candidatus Saccharibacteria bacterium RIFCSPHIGHO2_12_FULL_47_17]|nr:MAG: hypothetical protein A3F05_00520 [Candidatus Saccharibacteria bacterium RIFCSPHIGHO2_12_FULL_47_17]
MTTIRSSMSKTSSDLFKTNQTSNGVYPVRPHLLSIGYLGALENTDGFNNKLTLKFKAEV